MTPARVLTSRRAVTLQRRQHIWAPKRGRGAPTATTIGTSLDTSIVAAFPSGWLAQGGRARSPDGGRGTRMFSFISIVFTIKLLSRMPLRPAPAPARAAFSPKVPSGLTGRAPAWGAALSGCCPSRSPGRQDAEQRAERTKPFRAHQHRRRAVIRDHHGHPRPAPARGGDRDCTGPAKTCGALNLTRGRRGYHACGRTWAHAVLKNTRPAYLGYPPGRAGALAWHVVAPNGRSGRCLELSVQSFGRRQKSY